MPETGPYAINVHMGNSPWKSACNSAAWLKEMPLLFEQMTGYKLNELQLNNAIAEWARRLSKSERADTPGPHETADTPSKSYTGI